MLNALSLTTYELCYILYHESTLVNILLDLSTNAVVDYDSCTLAQVYLD